MEGIMNRGMRGLAVALIMVMAGTTQAHERSRATITVDGKINCPYISTNGGMAYVQVSITTSGAERPSRRPMSVAVVLDRSGSMADQGKIEHARAALRAIVDQLQPEDIFSLVAYDHSVDVLWPARRVKDKSALRRIIAEVYPGGNTNLGAGMLEGFRQIEACKGDDNIQRVVLLSDGLVNTGITDVYELQRIAGQYRSKGISLTTMGMGLDYNENLMVGLAGTGGGNYYFIESASSLAGVLEKEFRTISRVVAQDAVLELELGRGIRLSSAIGYECNRDGSRITIPIGDLVSNDIRELTLEVEIPRGTGSLKVMQGSLKFRPVDIKIARVEPFNVKVNYTRDLASIETHRDLKAQSRVDIALSTRKVEEAMVALDEGRDDDAQTMLKDARDLVLASPAAVSPELRGELEQQEEKLGGYIDTMKNNKEDPGRAKKAIQYDNYKVQKKK